MMANEGSYPENARALAMNGAEVLYRASIPHPAASNDYFEIQNRARALDNNLYILAPNMGTYYLTADSEAPIDTFGGNSMIVDYRGQIVGSQRYGGVSTSVCGPINIEALRHHRAGQPVDELDEGPPHRDVPDRLRAADLPEEPLPRPRAVTRTPSTRPRSPSARSA